MVRQGWRRSSKQLSWAVLCITMLSGACGMRVPHDEVVAASGGSPAGVAGAPGQVASGALGSTAATGTATAGAAGGSSAAGPGTVAAAGAGGPSGAATGGDATGAPAGPASGSPVVIGNVGTYSGVAGASLGGGQRMAQVWAAWVNAHGGLNGHPVELITADDGADPARNLSIVRDMVENRGAIAFVGNLVPLSIMGSLEYLQERNIPVVGGDLVVPTWTQSPVLFPQGTDTSSLVLGSASMAVAAGNRRIGLLYCSESTACTNANDVLFNQGGAQQVGAEPVFNAQVSIAQPDFTAECLSARSRDVEALLIATDGNTVSRVAQSCSQQGYHPQLITASLAVVNSLAENPLLEGLSAPSSTFPWMIDDLEAARQYHEAIATYAPDLEPAGATSAVWTAGRLLERAAAAISAQPTSQEIMQGLWALQGETLGGLAPPLTFAQGQPAPRVPCYFVVAIRDGRWTAPNGSTPVC